MTITQPHGHHLAQLNVAQALDDLDSARLADFVAALDKVNAVAERSPGFVWRLKSDDGGSSMEIAVSDDPRLIVNISVWQTPEHLEQFVWNTIHKRVYNNKANWFAAPEAAHFAMWWVGEGHEPSVEEGLARLDHLRANGPGEHAFGWESLANVTLWMSQRCA